LTIRLRKGVRTSNQDRRKVRTAFLPRKRHKLLRQLLLLKIVEVQRDEDEERRQALVRRKKRPDVHRAKPERSPINSMRMRLELLDGRVERSRFSGPSFSSGSKRRAGPHTT
jgi:hypothetical protein